MKSTGLTKIKKQIGASRWLPSLEDARANKRMMLLKVHPVTRGGPMDRVYPRNSIAVEGSKEIKNG